MKINSNESELLILLTIIFVGILEASTRIIFDTGIYSKKNLSKTEKELIHIFFDIAMLLLIIISLYLVFIKKMRSPIVLLICAIYLFKGFFHYLISFKLYKYFNLSKESQKKLVLYHHKEAIITGIANICLSAYLFIKLFLN